MTAQTQTGTKDKPFYLKSGEVSAYGLACGYVERTQLAPYCHIELYQESDAYHVRVYAYSTNGILDWQIWEVFDTLTDARNFYHAKIRE